VHHFSDPNDGIDHEVDDALTNDIEHDVGENASEQSDQNEGLMVD
jgi:hypothetical protein